MTTLEQRELAGMSLIDTPRLPSESKHTLDDRRDEARLHRIEAKELGLLNNGMVEYKKDLSEVLWNPRDKIMQQLKTWKYSKLSEQEALHVPYKRAA